MSKLVLKNARVLTGAFQFCLTDLVVEDGKILSVGPTPLAGEDLEGRYVIPGLIDIHTHGCAGGDHLDGDPEKTAAICHWMARHGTTGLLATVMTQAREVMEQGAANAAACARQELGARILGIYLEGPFFSQQYKGAQHPKYLLDPDGELLNRLQEVSGGLVRIVSLAPELPGAIPFIASRRKERIFLGHTASDYPTAQKAYAAGAVGLTHSFNGMTPLHHRKPGILAAAMERDGVFCECICDGFHVHPAMVALLYRQVGRERFCVISDSLRPTGLPDGEYASGGQPITVREGKALLADGTIAGSTACLLEEVRKLVEWGVCSLEDAVYAASAIPAKAAGVYARVGSLEAGKLADLVILDQELALYRVLVGGKTI